MPLDINEGLEERRDDVLRSPEPAEGRSPELVEGSESEGLEMPKEFFMALMASATS